MVHDTTRDQAEFRVWIAQLYLLVYRSGFAARAVRGGMGGVRGGRGGTGWVLNAVNSGALSWRSALQGRLAYTHALEVRVLLGSFVFVQTRFGATQMTFEALQEILQDVQRVAPN